MKRALEEQYANRKNQQGGVDKMSMDEIEGSRCPICGKEITDIDCIYVCNHCGLIGEQLLKNNKIVTVLNMPIGKIKSIELYDVL